MDRETYIVNRFSDIQVLANEAKVMIEDLSTEYFGKRIDSEERQWEIMPPYYDHAGIKACIINDIVCKFIKELTGLGSVLDSNNVEERELEINDLMEKYNCNRDIAEILLNN